MVFFFAIRFIPETWSSVQTNNFVILICESRNNEIGTQMGRTKVKEFKNRDYL